MIDQTYYVSWHTWLEQEVQTPWDFWYLSKGQKPKHVEPMHMDLHELQKIWQNQDVQAWERLQTQHMWDIKLAAFVDATSESHAQSQVTTLFPDALFDKCVQVDAVTKQQIIQLFGDTLSKAA